MQNKHSIYILKCGSFIKIGIAKNLTHRLTSIRTSNPYDVELVKSFFTAERNVSRKIEMTVHKKLTDLGHHHRLEWFNLSAIDKAIELCTELSEVNSKQSCDKNSVVVENNSTQISAKTMSISEIRHQLWDRVPSMVSRATGIHYNTIRAIRDGSGLNPTHSTLQRLSDYIGKNHG
jgi:hypothetical protein